MAPFTACSKSAYKSQNSALWLSFSNLLAIHSASLKYFKDSGKLDWKYIKTMEKIKYMDHRQKSQSAGQTSPRLTLYC